MSLSDRPQNRNLNVRARASIEVGRAKRKERAVAAHVVRGKRCPTCGADIPYERRNNKFCNSSCAASFTNRTNKLRAVKLSEQERLVRNRAHRRKSREKKKVGSGRVRRRSPGTRGNYDRSNNPFPFVPVRSCASCLKFHIKTKQKYCDDCSPNISQYRARAAFKFNVYKFPAEFDLSLIEPHGWYSPCGNHGKNRHLMNLDGVSRDHLFSVSDGFKRRVPPRLLAHPANCQLMHHRANSSKKGRSEISLGELINRVARWDHRYNGEHSSRRTVNPLPSRKVRSAASGSNPLLPTMVP